MAYVKITNGAVDQYPYTIGNLRKDNPNVSFPRHPSAETLEEWGVFSVASADAPSYSEATQKIQIADPQLIDGAWTQSWSVIDKTAEEITADTAVKAEAMRSDRDDKLEETDFYALSDVTMSAEMTTYRQALRDITSHANWPYLNDDDWPTKP